MLGRYDEAVAAYAIVAEPQVGILAGLAASHARAGDATAAKEARDRVLALAPNFSARRFIASKPFGCGVESEALLGGLTDAGLPL